MSEFVKFPSIEQFRTVVKYVRSNCDYHGRPYPKIAFRGSTKLHGTNAGIRLKTDGTLVAQSRERDLSIESDNAGFAAFVVRNETLIREWFQQETFLRCAPVTVIFGEWCGDNIQKGVALNQLPKMFVPFASGNTAGEIQLHEAQCSLEDGANEWNREIVPDVFYIDVDFSDPEAASQSLTDMTLRVEERCPFAASRGVFGIGEGIVWSPYGQYPDTLEYTRLLFKTKGEKHGNPATSQKVKIAVSAEKLADMNALVEKLLPQWRLNQGLEQFAGRDVTREDTGAYLKWVSTDVFKEESDTIALSGFEAKVVMAEVSKAARRFFFSLT